MSTNKEAVNTKLFIIMEVLEVALGEGQVDRKAASQETAPLL